MTDEERFDVVLTELGRLLLSLGDLARHVTLVGGQVPSVLGKLRGGSGVIAVTTDTGVELTRAFSLEPDLLVDTPRLGFLDERLPEVLRACGFRRTRSYRWRKDVGDVAVDLDLFAPPDADEELAPTPMTPLPSGDLALVRPMYVTYETSAGSFEVRLPNPTAFLAMKLDAKERLRPKETKDSFDLYAFVRLLGVAQVAASRHEFAAEGRDIVERLHRLFLKTDSPGVRDVLTFAPHLSRDEGSLVAMDAVDLMAELRRATLVAGTAP
jgi:hypothetical protein